MATTVRVICQIADLIILSVFEDREDLAAGATRTLNLDWPELGGGAFVGGSASFDSSVLVDIAPPTFRTPTGGNEMVYGDNMTGIDIQYKNNSASLMTVGVRAILFVRK